MLVLCAFWSLSVLSFASPAILESPLGWILAADTSLIQAWGGRLYNIALMMLGLGFVIFVHELGHFLAAKMFGVKCEKFYIGFDVPMKIGPIRLPSKLAKFQWGETEYGIGSIPLGGYVKMLGQDDDPRKLKEENQRIQGGDAPTDPTINPQENSLATDAAVRKLDPRSYPAKPVFARMIIISAGVIMNLIFGVLMAATAFRLGVPYTPAVLGSTMPGDPAWKAGLKSGDRIVGIESTEDDQMSFDEIRKKVAIGGIRNKEQPLELTYERQGERNKIKVTGSMAHADPQARHNFQTIGIRSTSITEVGQAATFGKLQEFENKKLSDLKPGDKILGVDGVLLESNDGSGDFFGYQLDEILHPKLNKQVELTVERKVADSNQTISVGLNPLPLKTLGLKFQPGAVSVVADDSPASKAGIQIGDLPVKFNGQAIADAVTLPNQVATMAGQKVSLELMRSNSDPVVLEWTVPTRFVLENDLPTYGPVGMEIPGSGLVYRISPKVASVTSTDPASESSIQPGDVVQQIQFGKLDQTHAKYLKDTKLEDLFSKQIPIDDVRNMQYVHAVLQALPAGMPLSLVVERNSKIVSGGVVVQEQSDAFSPDRRIALSPYRQTYVAKSWGQALQKGVQEIRRGIGDVLEFLQLIVTGKAFNYIGGPATIAVQATSAASQGVTSLLMFLTLLSANLAVVNFLPIPALDGGHMVFLAAEAITGKPVNEDLQMKLTIGGMIALLCLMVLAFRNDILFFLGAWM
jgi:regulator of sigma E protease